MAQFIAAAFLVGHRPSVYQASENQTADAVSFAVLSS
jgi:hypothetical protein